MGLPVRPGQERVWEVKGGRKWRGRESKKAELPRSARSSLALMQPLRMQPCTRSAV